MKPLSTATYAYSEVVERQLCLFWQSASTDGGDVQSITSSAFNKKHRLRSPSSTQTAALKLLEYDMITRQEKVYSLSDPLVGPSLNKYNFLYFV